MHGRGIQVSTHDMLSKIEENTVFVLQCLCSEGNFKCLACEETWKHGEHG